MSSRAGRVGRRDCDPWAFGVGGCGVGSRGVAQVSFEVSGGGGVGIWVVVLTWFG